MTDRPSHVDITSLWKRRPGVLTLRAVERMSEMFGQVAPPDAAQVETKRGVVSAWLRQGRVVLLQETHWPAEDASAQQAVFLAARLVATATERLRVGQP